jgi:hypothetical protein
MSEQRLVVAELRRNRTWSFASSGRRADVRWLPSTLPGADHDHPAPRPKPPARRRVRRGRIQFVLANAA